jgi:PGF-CTERM protein
LVSAISAWRAGSEIFGADCKLQFDNTILNATSQTGGTFLGQGGANTIEVQNSIDNDVGIVKYGETRMGDPDVIGSATEKGVLATITFEAIGSGTCDLELEARLADPGAQPIDAVVNGGTCSVEGASGGETPTAPTTHAKQTPEGAGMPGFGVLSSIIGLIAALLILRKDFR